MQQMQEGGGALQLPGLSAQHQGWAGTLELPEPHGAGRWVLPPLQPPVLFVYRVYSVYRALFTTQPCLKEQKCCVENAATHQ